MKRTLKNCLVFLLAAALLLPLGLFAAAENGPCPEDFDGWYFAYLRFTEVNADGTPVVESEEDGWTVYKIVPLFADNEACEGIPGAVYDKATNTLSLTDFKGSYVLDANMMGDDFKIKVTGDCSLARIVVWGDGWGGSLHITGKGSLTVNAAKAYENGVLFYPEGSENLAFSSDPQVKLAVYGSETAMMVSGGEDNASFTAAGAALGMTKQKAVRQERVLLKGYSNPMDWNLRLCHSEADPDGLYSIMTWYDAEDHTKLVNVTVERFIYLAKYDRYVRDYAWAEENGGDYQLKFADEAAAAAAGYTAEKDDNGNDVWMEIKEFGNHGYETVMVDNKGDEFVKGLGYDEERNFRNIAMTFEPIDEIPGEYVFTYTPDVDPEDLLEKIETVVHDDMFDYTYPGKELIAGGAADFLPGDVNNDGAVTAEDARYTLRAAVGLDDTAEGLDFSDPANLCYRAADVDGEAGISAADARLILRAAVGLEDLAA